MSTHCSPGKDDFLAHTDDTSFQETCACQAGHSSGPSAMCIRPSRSSFWSARRAPVRLAKACVAGCMAMGSQNLTVLVLAT